MIELILTSWPIKNERYGDCNAGWWRMFTGTAEMTFARESSGVKLNGVVVLGCCCCCWLVAPSWTNFPIVPTYSVNDVNKVKTGRVETLNCDHTAQLAFCARLDKLFTKEVFFISLPIALVPFGNFNEPRTEIDDGSAGSFLRSIKWVVSVAAAAAWFTSPEGVFDSGCLYTCSILFRAARCFLRLWIAYCANIVGL